MERSAGVNDAIELLPVSVSGRSWGWVSMSRRALLLGAGGIAIAGWGSGAKASMALTGMSSPAGSIERSGLADVQVMRFADVFPLSTDPAIAATPGTMPSLFEGLVRVNWTNNQLEPAQAASYQANADATVWTFQMRPGLVWSDGTPLTARDFEYSIKRIPDPKVASRYTAAVQNIKNGPEIAAGKLPPDQLGVSALDDLTLEITLNAPIPFFPWLTATWSYFPVPKHVIEKFGSKWTDAGNSVSNGPYILQEWKRGQPMIFAQNPNYWGPKPIISRVEVALYADPVAESLAAYEKGQLDTAQVPTVAYDRIRNDPQRATEMKAFPASSTFFITWDCTNKPTSDVNVRQALALGFDRGALIKTVLKDYYLDAPTMLPPDIPGYNPSAALAGGVNEAKQLLAAAGFPDGQGWPSDFTIFYPDNATDRIVLEFLQQEWKKNLGIDVKLQNMYGETFTAYRDTRKTQPFNGTWSNWGSDYGDPANWHNFLFLSETDYYHSRWKNAQFDTIVTGAKGMTDSDARTRQYQQAEQILVAEQPHLTLYHGQAFYVIKPTLQGVYHPAILGTVPRPVYASITDGTAG